MLFQRLSKLLESPNLLIFTEDPRIITCGLTTLSEPGSSDLDWFKELLLINFPIRVTLSPQQSRERSEFSSKHDVFVVDSKLN